MLCGFFMKDDVLFSKIYLNCRRGILELDVILLNFLAREYNNMDEKNLSDFCSLLSESDDKLYSWLVKRHIPEHFKLEYIVFRINLVTDNSFFES